MPIFIVGAPCSGQNALVAGLSLSPGLVNTSGTDFAEVAGVEIDPSTPEGDAVNAGSLSEVQIAEARCWTTDQLGEAAEKTGSPQVPLRTIGGLPRDSLRIGMLDAIFPDCRFVYVNRDPAEALTRMAAIWNAGTVVTHPGLPGWDGPEWTLPLIPDWAELNGRPVDEVVQAQWLSLTTTAFDALEQLSPDRWCVSDFSQLTGRLDDETQRLCRFLEMGWHAGVSRQVAATLAAAEQEFAKLGLEEEIEPDGPVKAASDRAISLIADTAPRKNPGAPEAGPRSTSTGTCPRSLRSWSRKAPTTPASCRASAISPATSRSTTSTSSATRSGWSRPASPAWPRSTPPTTSCLGGPRLSSPKSPPATAAT
ncbi:MAG: sulfotransferase [Thermoleophilia bacterium]|nr:sulfotransferase [Thermoleophilia bacterium]